MIGKPPIRVFPKNSVIFLMNADSVRDSERSAAAVHEMRVQIFDMPQAIASEAQAVGAHAHAVFTHVEGVLAHLCRLRIAVRHHHFGKRSAIENGTITSLVPISQMMDGQSFAGVEPDHEVPVLPIDLMTLERKA